MDVRELPRPRTGAAAIAGVVATGVGAAIGELAAALIAPSASPFTVIGGALIDAAPPWAKDAAIALFGTNDKAALLIGIGLVLMAAAAAAGVLESRRPWWGRAILLAFGVAGVAAALTRADATAMDAVPSVLAGVTSALTLSLLIARAPRTAARVPAPAPTPGDRGVGAVDVSRSGTPAAAPTTGVARRTFLVWTVSAAAVGLLATAGASIARAGSRAASAIREAVRLPAPTATASVPASAELGIPGLAPVITPNSSFYRIDTALFIPEIDPADWSLRIHGMVGQEVTLTWDELLALPLEESVTTLACVSNNVGGDLIGNALWLGYPIRELLARAVPDADADMVLSRSIDGFTASTPLEVLTDDRAAILAVGMNGEPLPAQHGFPVRMVVPGLYGYVSATKWVTELEVTRFDRDRAYWSDRGWSERGPVKLQSRIDVPRGQVAAGDTVIAGVAWQQHVGVAGVEVQVDDGAWQPATLATAISDDTWVQWSAPWAATTGRHTIRCRATSSSGEEQTDATAPPAPDGATGWHEIAVTVG